MTTRWPGSTPGHPVTVEHREAAHAGIRDREEVLGPARDGDAVGDGLGDRQRRGRPDVVDLDGEDPLAARVEPGGPEATARATPGVERIAERA